MTIVRGFSITLISGIIGGGLGALLGFALGRFAPDYYRLVFRIDPSSQFDPVQIGVGLGVTQGLAAGLIVGLVIVIAVAWYHSRTSLGSSSRT